MVIEAGLLDKTGNFIIDTGSETLLLNSIHFTEPYIQKKKDGHGVLTSIDGILERRIPEFSLDHFSLQNTSSDVLDLSHIEKSKKIHVLGVIGYSILKDFEVFVDMQLQQITISKVDRNGVKFDKAVYAEKIIDTVAFQLKGHTIVLAVTIEDKKLWMGLDTAAEFNQLNKNVSGTVLRNFFPKRRIVLSGAGKKKTEVLAGLLFKAKLSETVYFGPMNTVITNLTGMNKAFGTSLDGILGYDFFAQKRTIINYQKEELYFIANPMPKW